MTYYPKASAVGAGSTTSASNATSNTSVQHLRCSASEKFPEIEERILKYWDQDGTFQAQHRPAGSRLV